MNPGMPPYPGTNFERHKEQALIAEEFKADFFFVADTLWADEVSPPHRLDRFEATTLLAAIAAVTTNIGLVGTMSTTFCEPFNIARQILSLDHISNGRAGWNLVTTDPKGSSDNYGRFHGISHRERYEIGEEAYRVVTGLWDSFEDDALPQDKEKGHLPDPGEAPCAESQGQVFRVERASQPPPVAAGAAHRVHGDGVRRGAAFAARFIDCVFTPGSYGIGVNQEFYRKLKAKAVEYGRDPDSIAILPGVHPAHRPDAGGGPGDPGSASRADRACRERSNISVARSTGSIFATYDLDDPFPLKRDRERRRGVQGRHDADAPCLHATRLSRSGSSRCGLAFPRMTSWGPPRRSPTRCRNGSNRRPATVSCSSNRSLASCACLRIRWLRSCGSAGCFGGNMRARRSGRTWGCPSPRTSSSPTGDRSANTAKRVERPRRRNDGFPYQQARATRRASMTSCVVIGAGGTIGGALAGMLETEGRPVLRLGRATVPALDLLDEASIEQAARAAGQQLRLVIDATGVLHGEGLEPEKRLSQLDPAMLARAFAVNAIGPALLMKHFLPRLARDGTAVFASLSARVGSIGDNRSGGWYGYRASKAALNQLVRNSQAIELARTHPGAVCVALHPGTVDGPLTRPIRQGRPGGADAGAGGQADPGRARRVCRRAKRGCSSTIAVTRCRSEREARTRRSSSVWLLASPAQSARRHAGSGRDVPGAPQRPARSRCWSG